MPHVPTAFTRGTAGSASPRVAEVGSGRGTRATSKPIFKSRNSGAVEQTSHLADASKWVRNRLQGTPEPAPSRQLPTRTPAPEMVPAKSGLHSSATGLEQNPSGTLAHISDEADRRWFIRDAMARRNNSYSNVKGSVGSDFTPEAREFLLADLETRYPAVAPTRFQGPARPPTQPYLGPDYAPMTLSTNQRQLLRLLADPNLRRYLRTGATGVGAAGAAYGMSR